MVKILVAEDDRLMLSAIEFRLKKEGYQVITCPDGKSAIANIPVHLPDIVITDLMLPYALGFEIISHIKLIREKNIRILVLSAMGQEKTVEEAFELGADDYMTKPFNFSELSIRIKKLTKQGA
ncbi:MAG TPA: response regulator [Chitinophagaceae bacterium]|nr:response regulator [Chitinophagaceae bacterium]